MKILGDTIVCKIMHSQYCFSCGRHLATAETTKATEKIVLQNGGSIRKEDGYRAYCASHVPPNSSGLADELLPGIALPDWILNNPRRR
ncbi:MAG: hypothetical protein A2W33_04485 [Chloroflexi bacterium RBG_16_52_11]|nr:MAG: hypothetical protein A2W33_04485 [Chloroflexi bacterium RBG_16_52_11]